MDVALQGVAGGKIRGKGRGEGEGFAPETRQKEGLYITLEEPGLLAMKLGRLPD